MATTDMTGFDFSNFARNSYLAARGGPLPKATSTGTTIVGVVFDSGVILGADTRATEGPIVADLNCEKLHYIAPNIRCAGAGTAADTEYATAMIAQNIELFTLNSGRQARVVTAMTMLKQHLFKHQGHIGAALIIGGVDVTGSQLISIAPHGSTDKLPYTALGSGSLAAMAMLETRWEKDMSKSEAIELVCTAILAGIENDLGSGSNIDLAIMEKDNKTTSLRNYRKPVQRGPKERSYKYSKGATAILKQQIKDLVEIQEVPTGTGQAATATVAVTAMDTS